MPASNVFVAVANPDAIMAGTDPMCPFEADIIQLYRYTSEALAFADSGGTLATTFTLIPSTDEATAEAGPYRFGYYDSNALASSWYRYRFADTGLANFSPLSDPWPITNRRETELRELIFQIGTVMGDAVKRGTATAGDVDELTCTPIFKSTKVDERWHEGSYILIETTTDGLAPQGEERLIDSVAGATGVATLDGELTAAIGNGDIFQLHAYAAPSDIIRAINRVRERMFAVFNHDIAIDMTPTAGNRYPVPVGIQSNSDVWEVRHKQRPTNAQWEQVTVAQYNVEFDGLQGWIIFEGLPATHLIQVRYERSWRDYEGELLAMDDITRCPIQWLRQAAAYEVYKMVDASDRVTENFASLLGMSAQDVKRLSQRYAPESPSRPLRTGNREAIGPRRSF